MSAARRNAHRRTWPRGLYEPRPGYYVWRHPDGTVIPIGRVALQAAKAQACAANLKVEANAPSILEKLGKLATAGNTVRALLAKILSPTTRTPAAVTGPSTSGSMPRWATVTRRR